MTWAFVCVGSFPSWDFETGVRFGEHVDGIENKVVSNLCLCERGNDLHRDDARLDVGRLLVHDLYL